MHYPYLCELPIIFIHDVVSSCLTDRWRQHNTCSRSIWKVDICAVQNTNLRLIMQW